MIHLLVVLVEKREEEWEEWEASAMKKGVVLVLEV